MTETKEINPATKDELDIEDIIKLLPHRYPMLLVDRLKYLDASRRKAIGYKAITFNEPHFQGHFPGQPIMPGVMQVEAMAQAAGLMIIAQNPDVPIDAIYMLSIDNVRFRQPVTPGHMLEMHVEVTRERGFTVKFKGEAFIDGKLVSSAEFMAAARVP